MRLVDHTARHLQVSPILSWVNIADDNPTYRLEMPILLPRCITRQACRGTLSPLHAAR